MDNLTHSLVGYAAAKAGLERLSPYATPLCVIAANAPDADIITALAGPATYLRQHRGVSHSVIGTLVIALILPLAAFGIAAVAARWRDQAQKAKLGGLMLASLVTSASHPLLDWTNNYGIRPLLPWSNTWYFGDLVFIIDPWLWLSLGGVCFLLSNPSKLRIVIWALAAFLLTAALFTLPARAGLDYPLVSKILWLVGLGGLICGYFAHVRGRWGNGIAVGAFAGVIIYWGALSLLHERALRTVAKAVPMISTGGDSARYAAMPTFANPWRWRAIVDTPQETYRFDVNLSRPGEKLETSEVTHFIKPVGMDASAVGSAAQNLRARAFLEFSRFPAARVQRDCAGAVIVQFADLRYTEPNGRNDNFNVEVIVDE